MSSKEDRDAIIESFLRTDRFQTCPDHSSRMEASNRQIWLNFLSLLPGTTLTLLTIAVAFLRFYDERDFSILELIGQPRVWSNRLTVAALVVALVNFCVVERSSCAAWNRRNRETGRAARAEAQAENDRAAAVQRRAEEGERTARRARIQNRWIILQIRHQLAPSEQTRAALTDFASFLQES